MIRKLIQGLLVGGVISLLVVISAVAAQYSYLDLSTSKIGSIEINKFNEAPDLKVKVATGELPSVEKRLPEEPLVVEPVEEIGQYGGAWKDVHLGRLDLAGPPYIVAEYLLRYSPDFTKIVPNVAKDFKWNEDSKSVTFFLRKGMKWSDGEPFTADDFVFWYEDIVLNDELTPVKPADLQIGGELGRLEKIDDYTIKLSFSEPFGLFTEKLAGWWAPLMYAPKHYLEQFHPKYTSMEKIEKMMKKEGFGTWMDLFAVKNKLYDNPGELPVIDAWYPLDRIDAPLQRWARNPYYWKVDTEGNQLPYIDEWQKILVSDTETLLLKAIAGDIDFQYRRIQGLDNYTLIMENQEKGDYRVWQQTPVSGNLYTLYLNYHHKDPIVRELFWDKRFRVALSVAINRDEINELTQQGLGMPAQGVPAPGSPGYEESIAKLYTEYDPNRANQLLDEIGLKERDTEGYRLRSDGKRLRFVISAFTPWPPGNVEAMELIKGYWKDVGIQVVVKPTDRVLWVAQVGAGEHDIASYCMDSGWLGWLPLNNRVFPLDDLQFHASHRWFLWFATNGKSGEEPPTEVKRMMEIYYEALETTSKQERNELITEAFRISVENLLQIGILLNPVRGKFGIAKNYFRNITEPMSADLTIYHPASWFIKK